MVNTQLVLIGFTKLKLNLMDSLNYTRLARILAKDYSQEYGMYCIMKEILLILQKWQYFRSISVATSVCQYEEEVYMAPPCSVAHQPCEVYRLS